MYLPSGFAFALRYADTNGFLKDFLEVFIFHIVRQVAHKQGVIWRRCSCEKERCFVSTGQVHIYLTDVQIKRRKKHNLTAIASCQLWTVHL